MSKLSNKQLDERIAFIRDSLSKGMSQSDIGAKIGLTQGAIAYCIARYIRKSYKYQRARPTTQAGRDALRRKQYNYGGSERWQVADPAQFPDDIITEAVRTLGCDRRHAAWVLSCPRDIGTVRCAIGHRGGAAIG